MMVNSALYVNIRNLFPHIQVKKPEEGQTCTLFSDASCFVFSDDKMEDRSETSVTVCHPTHKWVTESVSGSVGRSVGQAVGQLVW